MGERKFKETHGLLETPLTSEEAFAVRVYIEKLQEELNYLAIAGLLKPNVQERLSKFRTIDFERGFKKLLGIGGTNDAEDNE